MKKNIYFFFWILISLGCEGDNELSDSTYIDDPINNGLPIYSEWGYNTFGAKYDRGYFLYDNYTYPMKVIVTNDTTFINFNGKLGDKDMTMTLGLTSFLPNEFTELAELNDVVFNLKDVDVFIAFSQNGVPLDITVIKGEFHFKRAQDLIVDGVEEEVILSGVFDCQFLLNIEPISITKGRFDIGVGDYNFFNY